MSSFRWLRCASSVKLALKKFISMTFPHIPTPKNQCLLYLQKLDRPEFLVGKFNKVSMFGWMKPSFSCTHTPRKPDLMHSQNPDFPMIWIPNKRYSMHSRTSDVYYTVDHVLVIDADSFITNDAEYCFGSICLYRSDASFLRGMTVTMRGLVHSMENNELRVGVGALKYMKPHIQEDGGRRVLLLTDTNLACRIFKRGRAMKEYNTEQCILAEKAAEGLEVGVLCFGKYWGSQRPSFRYEAARSSEGRWIHRLLASPFSPKMDFEGYDCDGLYIVQEVVGEKTVNMYFKKYFLEERENIMDLMVNLEVYGAGRLGRGYD